MKLKVILSFILLLGGATKIVAQEISPRSSIAVEDLKKYLKDDVLESLESTDEKSLAKYFREKFSERFFYDYKSFPERISMYKELYNIEGKHKERAEDHLNKFNDETVWKLPFDYKNGKPVNAYALRHLARQHKMVDIALYYFYDNKDPKYIQYFENQLQSLNVALDKGAYEKIKDGNGVYEAFRSGYRILNWLWIHNLFLNEEEYSDKDQLTTIATLLQHGQHMFEKNSKYHSGNHQTRGVSALTMLSILLRDFKGTDAWYERGMQRLSEHLDKEINNDGFQFERSVHYHMSDINTYYYVYQLAKNSNVEIDKEWEDKLRGLFTTLAKIAYPDKSAPVLQDDTDNPWAETNDISGAMTLGYLLFETPDLGYFASNKVDAKTYWFLSDKQLVALENIQAKKPSYKSLALEDTGYYIMREGWGKNDNVMIISAGLDDEKPDHQHGDMLGIQAIANGHPILPNYQVRYSLKDYGFFKNSMVKNVALVDDELLGKQIKSNKGGSGFVKFRELAKPEVIAWNTNKYFDLFVGTHNGFDNVGVDYTRQVIFVKDDFWIVKDNFSSDAAHEYKQVWQGHYTTENGSDLLRATTSDASGHDILQINTTDEVVASGKRGKQWSVVSKNNQKDFSFLTVIYPYKGYDNRINEESEKVTVGAWKVNQSDWEIHGEEANVVSSESGLFVFNAKELKKGKVKIQSEEATDVFIKEVDGKLSIQLLGTIAQKIIVINKGKKEKVLKPGEVWELNSL